MILFYQFIALSLNILGLYSQSLRKDLTNQNVHPWLSSSIPYLLGHPVIFLFLAIFSTVSFPKDLSFYPIFLMVGVLFLIAFYYKLKAFTLSDFSLCITISATTPFLIALAGSIFLGESLNFIQWISLTVSVIGVILIIKPEKRGSSQF